MKSVILFAIVLLLTSCKNDNPKDSGETVTKANTVAALHRLDAALKPYEVKAQVFEVASNKKSTVEGKLGTVIYVDPDALETTDGAKPEGRIKVELTELADQNALVRSNAQTVSGAKLLVSGGAYYLNMTANGKQLAVRAGKYILADFPKISDQAMSLFYGQKDSLGLMDWKAANTKFAERKPLQTKEEEYAKKKGNDIDDIMAYTGKDSLILTKEEMAASKKLERQYGKVYASMKLNKLGWINCDCFAEIENKTDLHYGIVGENIVCANVYIVFRDINSVMQSYYRKDDKDFSTVFEGLPIGQNIEVIAVAIDGEKRYTFKSAMKIKPNMNISIRMKEASEHELGALFNRIGSLR